MSMGTPYTYPIPPEQAVRNVAMDIILSLVTGGIWYFVWQYNQFKVVNAFLGRDAANFGTWLLLSLVTCGLYSIYFEYKFAQYINDVQRSIEQPVNTNLPMMSLILGLCGLAIVADAIQQNEINRFYGVN